MITTWNKINELYGGKDKEMLLKAYDYAKEAHANQKRASGEPYFIHPCAVALILMELGLDAPTVAAALLHDVIEDTPVTEEDIKREFGDEILELVSGVTKLDKIVFESQEQEEAGKFSENFRRHGERYPRHHHQIGRQASQYAFPQFPLARKTAENGEGNAGHLYAARGAFGYFADQVRIGGFVSQISRSRSL